jgi:transposase
MSDRSSLKNQVHAVLAKEGVSVAMSDVFGVAGSAMLDTLALGPAYRSHVDSLRRLIAAIDKEIARLDREIAKSLKDDRGYNAIQEIQGIGPVFAAIFVTEIGDVTRFTSARHLCSWAGLTPRHRESDTTVRRGHITKQGSTLVRWAAVEASIRQHKQENPIAAHRIQVAERRGKRIGNVAAARKLLILVYYGLRDGEIRCLARER